MTSAKPQARFSNGSRQIAVGALWHIGTPKLAATGLRAVLPNRTLKLTGDFKVMPTPSAGRIVRVTAALSVLGAVVGGVLGAVLMALPLGVPSGSSFTITAEG
jgi:hypothetical protein